MNVLRALTLFLVTLPAGNLPFHVDATENVTQEFPGAPHIQSFAFAQWEGRWVFIGGRIAGYHSPGGATAEFLRADANREVWVVDTKVHPARTYHVPVETLPEKLAPVRDQWVSTAQLYFQDAAKLYIAGGYGQNQKGEWSTYPLISKVDLPQLIEGVMHGRIPPTSISFAQSPLVQSSGGELMKLPDGHFYLIMGHVFQGSYTAFEGQGEHSTRAVSQEYLNEIRKLEVAENRQGELSVTLLQTFRDGTEFRRRDLNAAPILSPSGLGLAVYGGVFTPDKQLNYTRPVYLFPNSAPELDSVFEQKMNAYNCAKLLMYDRPTETMYTTFFGGISRHSWDRVAERFVENEITGSKHGPVYLDGMQWSDQISTVRRAMSAGNRDTSEFVHTAPLPGFLGTDAVFIPAADVARAHSGTDILDMNALRGKRVFVGYLYGGIQASPYHFPYLKTAKPYNSGVVPTKPSEYILKVYVQTASVEAQP